MSRRVRHYAVAAILLLALATVGACSSSSSTSTTTSAAGGSAAAGSAAQALDTAYKGVMGAPPTTPTKAKAGVNLWVVSCGESVPSCSTVTAAAMVAGQLVGCYADSCVMPIQRWVAGVGRLGRHYLG